MASADPVRRDRTGRARRLHLILLAGGCALLVWLLWGFDWPAIGAALAGARHGWLPAVVGLTVAYLLLRSWRWWILLRAVWPELRFWPTCAANAVGVGLGNVTPAQSGELAKIELAARATGLRRVDLASSFVLERGLDFAALGGIFLAGGAALARGLEVDLGWLALLVLPALALALAAGLVWRDAARRIAALLRGYLARPGVLLAVVALTLASWAAVVLTWVALARWLGIPMDLLQAMALVGGVTFIRVLTLVPGGVGVDEAGIVGLMLLMDFAEPAAQAYALTGRLIDVVLLLLAAATFLARRRARASARAREPSGAAGPR